jgi:hypothetical protein
MNYIKEFEELNYKHDYLQNELDSVQKQIIEVRFQIQESCDHNTIKAYRDYDGHATKIDYVCKSCHKSLYVRDFDKNATVEYC